MTAPQPSRPVAPLPSSEGDTSSRDRSRLVVIAGPTASGKSALALSLAERLDGEIVSADSMQVYRGLDIGTAKPSPDERARVRHHLVDVVEPEEVYNAGRFRDEADAAIREIVGRGRVPLVCGGTGLYLKALLRGLAPGPGRDARLRAELEALWDGGGRARLLRELQGADPAAAARLHPNDRTRVIRAVEVWRLTGQPFSAIQQRHGFAEAPYEALVLGVSVERAELYRRIDQRTTEMMEAGWVDEVRGLLRRGCHPACPALQAIGYRQLVSYLLDGGDLGAVVREIQRETRRLAKRQLTWLRPAEVEWVEPGNLTEVVARVRKHLQTPVAPLR